MSISQKFAMQRGQMNTSTTQSGSFATDELPTDASQSHEDGRTADLNRKLEKGTCVGRYFIISHLGQGGMGVLYKAYDPDLDRQIALKFISVNKKGSQNQTRARSRLMREAQALAQLSHPNVVSVYDVGTFGDDVFIAMELIEGITLSQWMRNRERDYRQVISLFLDIGQGLRAAHESGIVHRDFKPDNVIVGQDQRPRVVDFGLAGTIDGENDQSRKSVWTEEQFQQLAQSDVDSSVDWHSISKRRMLHVRLTRYGTIMGTPRYMAPEQHIGLETNERTDQFAFCLVLYQALYGKLAFRADKKNQIRKAVLKGELESRTAHPPVPQWVHDVVLRGLSVVSCQRYPDMKSLLEELSKNPELEKEQLREIRRRATRVGGGAFLLSLAIFALLNVFTSEDALCSGADEQFNRVWNNKRARLAEAAFIGTGKPYAVSAWQHVQEHLLKYGQTWTAMHTAACRATRVTGEQSEELLDLRIDCLDRCLEKFDALAELFVQADSQIVEKSVQAAQSLRPLSRCANRTALSSPIKPPADEKTKREVEKIQKSLARVQALENIGKIQAGLELARELFHNAREVAYEPLVASTQYWLGRIQEKVGDFEAAEKNQSQAYWKALAMGQDRLSAQAANSLINHLGYVQTKFKRAKQWKMNARAVIRRLGTEDVLLADWHTSVGSLHYAELKYKEALEHHQEALEIRIRLYGQTHPQVAESLNNVGACLDCLGDYTQAIGYYKRALRIRQNTLGPDHPDVGQSLYNLGFVSVEQGAFTQAILFFGQSRSIYERSVGIDHYVLGIIHSNLGGVFRKRKEFNLANEHYRESLRILIASLGPDHSDVATCLSLMGSLAEELGQHSLSRSHLTRALNIRQKVFGADHPKTAEAYAGLASLALATDRSEEGEALYNKAISIMEKHYGQDHPKIAGVLFERAKHLVKHGQKKAALRWLQRSMVICQSRTCDSFSVPQMRFLLAKLLWNQGRDKSGALALAQKAKVEFLLLENTHNYISQVEKWLLDRG